MRELRAAVVVGLLALAASATAAAQSEDPEALVHEGVVLRNHGHDAEALELFRRAYEHGHHINALGLMGFTEGALGQWVAAERDVREALSHADDPWVQRSRTDLEQAQAAIALHVGTLEVNGAPAGAHVFVNGLEVGVLPLSEPLHVEAGTVALEVRADGHYPVNRSVVVTAGQSAQSREFVDLPAMQRAAATHSPLLAVSPPPTGGRFGVSPMTVALWTSGGVMLAGGIVALLAVYGPANDSYTQNGCPASRIAGCSEWGETRIGGLVAGSAAIVIGVVASIVTVVRDVRSSRTRGLRAALSPGPHSLAVTFGGTF